MRGGDILAELRAWRDEFARSHGYDLGAMVAALRKMDAAAGARVVRGDPRRPIAMPPGGRARRTRHSSRPGHISNLGDLPVTVSMARASDSASACSCGTPDARPT